MILQVPTDNEQIKTNWTGWIDFHKVQELTKSARFAQTPSSYIDLDFHRFFKGKEKIF